MAKRKKKVVGKPIKVLNGDDTFTIERGIPVPAKRKNNPFARLLESLVTKMGDGESVFVNASQVSLGAVTKLRQDFNRENDKKYIISRRVDEPIKGTRVWVKHY